MAKKTLFQEYIADKTGMAARVLDLTGHRYGKLTVESFAGRPGKFLLWNCLCDCGRHAVRRSDLLREGSVISCGCARHQKWYDQNEIHRRFWSNVQRRSKYVCWEWTGPKNQWGYGIFGLGRKHLRAHRYSYEIANGKIVGGKFVLHSCDNPACVNPHHLRLGTHQENMDDMNSRRRPKMPQGSKMWNAMLTEKDVIAIRKTLLLYPNTTAQEIADKYGVSREAIYSIKHRRTWKHLP